MLISLYSTVGICMESSLVLRFSLLSSQWTSVIPADGTVPSHMTTFLRGIKNE